MFEFTITQLPRARRNRVINFSVFGWWQLNILFEEGRAKFRI